MGMWFLSSRKLLYSSMVVLLIISVLHIWVFCDCRAGAMRIFPGKGMRKITESQGMKDSEGKGDLFQKYFNGRSFSFNRTDKGFEESKRRVPSCPDPLHN
ncbi:hypothetical protein CRYUN_Cryun04dG0130300 [Craigia yunnanensis]